ncbi:hypothetical protein DFP74_6690 [Nocardiopsis sp. Huas11]|uniref:hypothetical protein n=1 Tax=Nocardiopsis sp. Huas11 TaxID=2183912 RepID=UPI000F1954C0|nr:hypothetical protein [Nocardiopsis sp. Huas11]RKR98969.1 hypothetical protein DFP74_6690 [Nocardiopsis sp. Huas11]
MARKSLEDLLAEDTAEEAAVPAPPPPAPARELRSREKAPEGPDSGSPDAPETGGSRSAPRSGLAHHSRPKAKASPRAKKKAAPAAPKWTTLERKDALLWQEQIEALTDLRRDLQRRKRQEGGGGERITENTLIRVAVAALLEHRDALTGKDETELRESLMSVLRES